MLKEIFKMSWSNIIHNKIRSLLTVLGIVIGVASIIGMMIIGNGATSSITSEISELGGSALTVKIIGTSVKDGLNDEELEEISRLDNVLTVAPSTSSRATISYGYTSKSDIDVSGRSHTYFNVETDILSKGRSIKKIDVDNRNNVAILGGNIADELFGNKNPVGQEVVVNGYTFNVIGVMKSTSGSQMSSDNDKIVVPYTTAERTLKAGKVSNIEVYMEDSEKIDETKSVVDKELTKIFDGRDDSYSIFDQQEMLDTVTNVSTTMKLLLAGIASISLLVGGIGIMNMMLVSVTERTNEIGLRKSLGANPKQIMAQFLIESTSICIIGGIGGIIVGLTIGYIGSLLIGVEFSISVGTIILAFVFSAAIGLIFGVVPAKKASKLNTIDALRHV